MCALQPLVSINTVSPQPIKIPVTWHAKIFFTIIQGHYTIKIADSSKEFQDVMELRKEVFLGEFAAENLQDESDSDQFDAHADFLIIKKHGRVIASYRLICSAFSDKFYSATEFEAKDFFKIPEQKLELSRACVKKEARTSIALHLLWRGLAEYMVRSGARYLFGCSSVQSLHLKEIVKIYRHLIDIGVTSQEFDITPKNHYHFITIDTLELNFDIDMIGNNDLIPPLLWGYLKAGAKIFGPPAIDLRFGCIDFFTVLDFRQLSSSYHKKYIRCQIQ